MAQTALLMTWACGTYEINKNFLASVIEIKSPCFLLNLRPTGCQSHKGLSTGVIHH